MLTAIENTKQQMAGLKKTEQFLQENKTWKRLLYFFVQENIFLKTRLSEVVDRETDKIFIENAEHFQNEFLLKDEFIREIGIEIKGQEKNLQMAFTQKKGPDTTTCELQEKLRNDMSFLEKEFSDLKNQFNKYLLNIV